MSFEVITPFKGKVFGVETNDHTTFNSVSFLHDEMLNRSNIFDENVNMAELVIDLMHAFERQFYKTDFSQAELENELSGCIKNTTSFSELRFEVFNDDHHFADINEKIKNGAYLVKNA